MRSFRRASTVAFAAASALSFATGCFKATLSDAHVPEAERKDVWLHQFVYGLVGSSSIDVRNTCQSGAAGVGVFESAATFAATVVTLGMYTPHVARITCAVPPREGAR